MNLEERLILSERQFRSVIESSPMGIHLYEVDSENRLILTETNAASDQILGINTSELIGLPLEEAFPPLKDTEIPHRYREAAEGGTYWKTEQIDYKDAKITGAYEVHAFQTRPGAMAVFFLEVSERIRARKEIEQLHEALEYKYAERTRELEEAKDHLVEAEKMSALGRLVAGISHEINTPVGVCKTGISFIEDLVVDLQDKFSRGELTSSDFEKSLKTMSECAASSHKSIDRAASLIQSFKKVAVDQSNEEMRKFNVRSYIDEILLSLYNQIKNTSCDIDVTCSPDLYIESYPGPLFQIVSNLVMNTIYHGLDENQCGTILIRIEYENGEVLITYTDQGPGLDSTGRKMIFEPFYTTRREQGGTGLGMHIVYNIVTQTLNGSIECPHNPEGGFLCRIRFPATAGGKDQTEGSRGAGSG